MINVLVVSCTFLCLSECGNILVLLTPHSGPTPQSALSHTLNSHTAAPGTNTVKIHTRSA